MISKKKILTMGLACLFVVNLTGCGKKQAQTGAKEVNVKAMKVIKRALKANNITYSIDSGGYIKKINGLGEFDCGQQSGWLYRVNGITKLA